MKAILEDYGMSIIYAVMCGGFYGFLHVVQQGICMN